MRLSDSCMNCLSRSSNAASPLGPLTCPAGWAGRFGRAARGAPPLFGRLPPGRPPIGRLFGRSGAGSAFLMDRLIFPSGVTASTRTFTLSPSFKNSLTSLT